MHIASTSCERRAGRVRNMQCKLGSSVPGHPGDPPKDRPAPRAAAWCTLAAASGGPTALRAGARAAGRRQTPRTARTNLARKPKAQPWRRATRARCAARRRRSRRCGRRAARGGASSKPRRRSALRRPRMGRSTRASGATCVSKGAGGEWCVCVCVNGCWMHPRSCLNLPSEKSPEGHLGSSHVPPTLSHHTPRIPKPWSDASPRFEAVVERVECRAEKGMRTATRQYTHHTTRAPRPPPRVSTHRPSSSSSLRLRSRRSW